jgi:hypothetical protein
MCDAPMRGTHRCIQMVQFCFLRDSEFECGHSFLSLRWWSWPLLLETGYLDISGVGKFNQVTSYLKCLIRSRECSLTGYQKFFPQLSVTIHFLSYKRLREQIRSTKLYFSWLNNADTGDFWEILSKNSILQAKEHSLKREPNFMEPHIQQQIKTSIREKFR